MSSQDGKSHEYYESKAEEFYDNTIDVDLSDLYSRFCEHLKPNARILDAGCGSGRDASKFIEMGYRADAFDTSPEMVRLARERTGIDAVVSNFYDYKPDVVYNGIWCCASLLHVPFKALEEVMHKMSEYLKSGGVWYMSFKHGNTERVDGGRCFTDLDETMLNEIIGKVEVLELYSLWQTPDARPDRDEVWLNAIVKKV